VNEPSIGIITPNDFIKRLPFGGGSGFIQNVARDIKGSLTVFGCGANGTALWKTYEIERNINFIATYPIDFPSAFPLRLKALTGYLKNRGRILKSNMDILYIHSPECTLPFIYGRNRKKVVFHQHGSGNPVATAKFNWARNRLLARLFDQMHREIYHRADWVIAIDRLCRAQAEKSGAGGKTSLLMNAVDMNQFRPDTAARSKARSHHEIAEADVVILFVGRLEEIKQVDRLVKSLVLLQKELPVHLFIAGDGSEAKTVRKLINTLNLSPVVHFLGQIQHNRLHEYYNAADVLALPSKMEGIPMVILEALACGTPVVASAVGGIPDLVRTGENGVLLNDTSIESIAAGIMQTRERNYERKAVSATVEELSSKKVAERLNEIFRQITG